MGNSIRHIRVFYFVPKYARDDAIKWRGQEHFHGRGGGVAYTIELENDPETLFRFSFFLKKEERRATIYIVCHLAGDICEAAMDHYFLYLDQIWRMPLR